VSNPPVRTLAYQGQKNLIAARPLRVDHRCSTCVLSIRYQCTYICVCLCVCPKSITCLHPTLTLTLTLTLTVTTCPQQALVDGVEDELAQASPHDAGKRPVRARDGRAIYLRVMKVSEVHSGQIGYLGGERQTKIGLKHLFEMVPQPRPTFTPVSPFPSFSHLFISPPSAPLSNANSNPYSQPRLYLRNDLPFRAGGWSRHDGDTARAAMLT